MDLICLLDYDDIFNYLMQFINVLKDAIYVILDNKKLYAFVTNHELFQNYVRLMKSPKLTFNIPGGIEQYYFAKACLYGNIIYKNITATNKIDIHANDEYVFKWICSEGYIEVAKWLAELN